MMNSRQALARSVKQFGTTLGVTGLAWLPIVPLAAEDAGWKPDTARLEGHLLRWPCFERPFNQLLGYWFDASEWKSLDAHLAAKQEENPRYRILRGMLAERLGDFDRAAAHYAALAGGDDWGSYHRARLAAFVAEIDLAEKELDSLARTTGDSFLFKLSAAGLAELMLLRGDLEAAEKFYEELWQMRPDLSFRLSILESVLSVKTERGTARAWLKGLSPNISSADGPIPPEEVDRGLLRMSGDSYNLLDSSLTSFASAGHPPFSYTYLQTGWPRTRIIQRPTWYDALTARGDPARWVPALYEASGYHSRETIDGVLSELDQQDAGGDTLFKSAFDMSANALAFPPSSALPVDDICSAQLARARAIRNRLRKFPPIASPIFMVVTNAGSARKANEVLSTEVFDGIDDPVWRFYSLLLRVQAGEPPAALREDALRLWQDVNPHDVYNLLRDCPDGSRLASRAGSHNRRDFSTSVLFGRGLASSRTEVIWNLRGAAFVDAMRVRLPLGLQCERLPGESFDSAARPKAIDTTRENRRAVRQFAEVGTGSKLLRKLWLLRDEFGLGEAELGRPGEQDAGVVDRTIDVLVRFDVRQVREFALAEPGIASLPGYWLNSLRNAVNAVDPGAADPGADRQNASGARRRIDGIVAARHPDWFVCRMIDPEPDAELPAPDAASLRELLAAHDQLRGVVFSAAATEEERVPLAARWTAFWRQASPGVEEDGYNALAAIEARLAVTISTLPHALWGLDWMPSVSRTAATLSATYDLAPQEPAFLVDRLPKLLADPPQYADPKTFDPGAVLPRISVKLVTAYGSEVLNPSQARAAELRPLASAHPFVADLLGIWSAIENSPPSSLPVRLGLSAEQVDRVLRVLEDLETPRAKMLLASIHYHYGDRAEARDLAEDLAQLDGPAGTYLADLNSGRVKGSAPNSTPATPANDPKPTREHLVARAKSVLESADPTRPATELLRAIVRDEEERRWLYDWLRAEARDDPAFARNAALMAAVARSLNLTEAEIAIAEALDAKLNQNGADYWLRRQEDLAEQEAASLIEAVKRSDFSTETGRSAWWKANPALQRAIDAGRAGDLAAAFETAMRQNPPGTAEGSALTVFQRILTGIVDDRQMEDRGERFRRLLGAVFEHQRQLILLNYDFLFELDGTLEDRGEKELATFLARLVLRGAWPMKTATAPERTEVPPNGVRYALRAWSEGSEDEIDGKASILPLFERALRGEDADEFVRSIEADARENPADEHLVSCALMALAMRGALPDDVGAILEKQDPQAAMRIAWRLCEHGPSEHVRIPDLVPALEQGLAAIFEPAPGYRHGTRHYLLAAKVCPWIERGGGAEAIGRLLPRFVELAEGLSPSYWFLLARMAAQSGDADALASIAGRWEADCEKSMAGPFRTDWTTQTIVALTDAAALAAEGGAFAELAHRVWTGFDAAYGATTDLSADTTDRVGATLLAIGDRDRLDSLADAVGLQARLGGDPALADVLGRLRHGLATLAEENPALPLPDIWIDPPSSDGEPSVLRWRLSIEGGDVPALAPPLRANQWERGRPVSPLPPPRFAPPLKVLGGRYDLEVLAGPSPSDFRVVAKIPHAAAAGSVELRDLPVSGWIRGVLRVPDAETASFGGVVPFASSPPLIDSSHPEEGEEESLAGEGLSIGKIAELADGTSVLLRVQPPPVPTGDGHSDLVSGMERLTLVGLDEERRPLARFNLAEMFALASERHPAPDGSWTFPLDLSRRPDGRRTGLDAATGESAAGDPTGRFRFVALASRSRDERPAPRVRVWALAPDPFRQTPAAVTVLEHKVVAQIGFDYRSWHVLDKVPLGAFSGKGRLAVFDTSGIPWRPLLDLRDPRITDQDSVYAFDGDSVFLSQWRADQEKGCSLFRVVWKDAAPASLDHATEIELPFDPATGADGWKLDLTAAEFAPDGSGVLLMAGGRARPLRVVWIDAAGRVSSATVNRPHGDSDGPKVAWWGKEGSIVVFEKGFLHHFERGPEALVPGRIEEGVLEPAEIPEGAVRGRGLLHRRWALRRQDYLVRRDTASGAPLEGYRVKVPCIGLPIWLSQNPSQVFLKTTDFQLIRVETPPVAEENAAFAAPVLVAAHRGGYATDRADRAPENSVANVAVAIRKGFDLYETDIQRTKDGVFVIVHDETLERETTGEGRAADLTLSELKALSKRYRDGSVSEERVATLEELLLAGKGRIRFKADLKPGLVAHLDELARLIHRLGMVGEVFLRCSRKEADEIGEAFDSGVPKVELMVKVDTAAQVRDVSARFSPKTIQVNVAKDEILSPSKIEAIETAVGLGILVQTHSYGDPVQREALVAAGVRMFHTAIPEETLEWLRGKGWR